MVRFGGTAGALTCTPSLRKSRMTCWSSEVLDSWDSRFVRFPNNCAPHFALSLLWRRTSRRNSPSLCRNDQFSGPADDWAARDSSNISRHCCVSLNQSCQVLIWSSAFLTSLLAWRLPSVVLEDWILHVNHVLFPLASILLMSLPSPTFLAYFQELGLLPERIACHWENRVSASCSSCRTCICTV